MVELLQSPPRDIKLKMRIQVVKPFAFYESYITTGNTAKRQPAGRYSAHWWSLVISCSASKCVDLIKTITGQRHYVRINKLSFIKTQYFQLGILHEIERKVDHHSSPFVEGTAANCSGVILFPAFPPQQKSSN